LCFSYIHAEPNKNLLTKEFPKAKKEAREKYKKEMLQTIDSEIKEFQKNPSESKIQKTFSYLQTTSYTTPEVFSFFQFVLNPNWKKSDTFLTEALETTYTIYPTELAESIEEIFSSTKNLHHFAIAALYKLRLHPHEHREIASILESRFTDYKKTSLGKVLHFYLETPASSLIVERPNLLDLFTYKITENQYTIFSFHRLNRNHPGILVIKKPDGNFLRREDGTIFHISQIGRSISNLPSFLFNGNTPQGFFSIQNIYPLQNEVIGPTPAIITNLPHEVSVNNFFHGKKKGKWNLNLYLELFPPSWRNYFPIQESYHAGQIGRSAIFSHGTTIDPEFSKGKPYYPNSPTKGCLSAKEIWSKENGKLIYSEQTALLKEIQKFPNTNGLLVVIDLDNQEKPVTLDEILLDILEAESFISK
jgi:hypothetical protein